MGALERTGGLHRARSPAAPKVADFLKELQHIKVVRCDEVQIRILGLSLANWNVVISAALAALAARAAASRD